MLEVNGHDRAVVRLGRARAHQLTAAGVLAVARGGAKVRLTPQAAERVRAARTFVERISKEPISVGNTRRLYGIATGFGDLSREKIEPDQRAKLQRNLIRSHASGIGEPLDIPTTRAVMLLLASSLAHGHSGVRLELLELLLGMLNAGVTPIVPRRGSVGASGDLAPLAHLSLVLIGEGQACYDGQRMPGAEALRRARLKPITLEAKEGLALVNGTHVMEACGILALADAWRLVRAAEVAAAMSIEALMGSFVPFDARIHALRPQRGQVRTAARLRMLLGKPEESEINQSHKDCDRVQDPYTMRCVPQVLGAARDALEYCDGVFAVELDAVTDNPLLFPEDDEVLIGGNFHGQPLALALDFLAVALAQVASFSERRIYNLLGPHAWDKGDEDHHKMLDFLTFQPGISSGYMIAQYAAAALVNEIKILAHPASIDSIPTCAGMEDFVSMGMTSASKLASLLELAYNVVAIELICGAQGLEFRRLKTGSGEERAVGSADLVGNWKRFLRMTAGPGVEVAYSRVRGIVEVLEADRPPAPDIESLASAVRNGLLDELAPEEALDPPRRGNGRR